MYELDRQVTVSALPDLPPSSSRAPCPIVLSDEQMLVLAYYLEVPGNRRSELGAGARGPLPVAKAAWAVVEFVDFRAVLMGPSCEGPAPHPLAARGVERYAAYEVGQSSWIRRIDPNPDRADTLRHFLLTFHDSTFECVARGYRVSLHEGPLRRVLAYMQQRLVT